MADGNLVDEARQEMSQRVNSLRFRVRIHDLFSSERCLRVVGEKLMDFNYFQLDGIIAREEKKSNLQTSISL